ncbi:hypothetical protein QZH41_013928, partial [Actinostola sp. cb2023]
CTPSNSSHDIDATVPGEIVSPGYPGSYPNNQDCTWKLKVPLGSVVRVTITKLNLEQSDSLSISDGETAFGSNLIGKYSLCMEGPLSLFGTGIYMYIEFKSNDKETKQGFRIEYKTVRKGRVTKTPKGSRIGRGTGINRCVTQDGDADKICSFMSVVRGTSGYVGHPGFPGSIKQDTNCYWQIIGTSEKSLYLSYKMIGLVPKSTFSNVCEYDLTRYSYGGGVESGSMCGCALPPNGKGNAGNNAYLNLKSFSGGRKYHQAGFLLYFKAMDSATCPNQASCSALNDDRDIGFDRHANIKFEPLGSFDVTCTKDEMKVALNFTNFPILQQESATLLDSKCKSYLVDATHVYISTPLDGCATYQNYSSDGRYIAYHNQIVMQTKATKKGDIITREHEAVFHFECRYHRKMVMSVVHFTPARAKVFTITESFGNFTYMMSMFKSKEYKEAHDDYPVQVLASKMVYLQTEVKAEDAELVLLVEKCKVTPSKDRNDKEFYDIIEKGCAHDETLEYHHKLSPVQRFNFRAFYFEVDRKASIHIHCTVRVCRKVDKKSRCVKGCEFHDKRRRREADASEESEITGTLTIGPIDVQQEGQTGKHLSRSML